MATVDAARLLRRLGLNTPADFLLHLPLRYEDHTRIWPIASLRGGDWAQVEGEVTHLEQRRQPRRLLQATLEDDSGVAISLRFLNVYPGQAQQLAPGSRVRARGEVRSGVLGLEMVHPKISRAGTPLPQTLTPVYPTTQGLAQPVLRRHIQAALTACDLTDTLPDDLRQAHGLIPFAEALQWLHAPPLDVDVRALQEGTHPAWERIKFDELLAQQLSLAQARARRRAQRTHALPLNPASDALPARLRAALPFTLTEPQERVVAEIAADLALHHPMHRLLQGDVGSGKTVVAALAAAQAIAAGAQVALMAPTELLAAQHHRKLNDWLAPLGVNVAWLAGSVGVRQRRATVQGLADGSVDLVVGTQALIQDGVAFARLGLSIVDEQHRFGVGQRLTLGRKATDAGEEAVAAAPDPVHQLMMSATPIPRTLAMTFLADLDVSVIDGLPPGRTPVVTKLVSDARREEVIARVAATIAAGGQAYWVCPLVEESETLQLQTAVDTHATLQQALPDIVVGLVHGRQPAAEKAEVMRSFQAAETGLLVATTVIEVGVDVPNATLMVIEHAERFGLAQLHQLRGRVGRGTGASVCVLLYQGPLSALARDRLRTLYETDDGFQVAERDLELRGPGEFLGVRQSGVQLFRFADLQNDEGLLPQVQAVAEQLLQESSAVVETHLARWLRGRDGYLDA